MSKIMLVIGFCLGMSVVSGRFTTSSHIVIASGAPRSNSTGQVYIFGKKKGLETMIPLVVLSGDTFSSQFGYDLAEADVNGDGLPDLIVGAPFFYSKDAGGAIYVYLNSLEKGITNNTVPQRITGQVESRFGFALANLKDINKDGYEDVVVGAPYDRQGAVYIYLGSEDGLQKEPAQVIRAQDIPGPTINTFGYSVAGGLDMDKNGYPDLAVGAYEADKVVLLRARPILEISTKVEAISDINPNDITCPDDLLSTQVCFPIVHCYKFSSVNITTINGLRLQYRLEAETFSGKKFSRVTFRTANTRDDSQRYTIERLLNVTDAALAGFQCNKDIVYLKEGVRDILNPIPFRLTYTLVQEVPKLHERRLANIDQFPILNQQEASKIFNAHFEKDCGDDDVCQSDLEVLVSTNLPGRELHLGRTAEIVIDVSVINRNESAYEAALYVSHPASVSFIGRIAANNLYPCKPENATLVICNLGNPFKRTPSSAKVSLRFNPSAVDDIETRLHFVVKANSTSVELNVQPDEHIDISVIRKAELEIYGGSSPEQVFYGGELRGESAMIYEDDVGSALEHKYEVINRGPWKVGTVRVTISWPFEVENGFEHGKWLLYLTERPTIDGLGDCYMGPGQVNPLGLKRRHTEAAFLSAEPVRSPSAKYRQHEAASSEEDPESSTEYSTEASSTKSPKKGKKKSSYKKQAIKTSHTETEFSRESAVLTSDEQREKRAAVPREARIKAREMNADGSTYKVVTMDCKQRTAKCFEFRCDVRQLKVNHTAVIRIKARLWNSTFVEDYPHVDWVEIVSSARLSLDPALDIRQNTANDFAEAETRSYPDILISQKPKKVPLWIIIVSVIAGILLLALIIGVCYKMGFFKRKRHDDMMRGSIKKSEALLDHNGHH